MSRDSPRNGTADRFLLATISLVAIGFLWLTVLPLLSMTPGEARERRQAPHLPPATAPLKSRYSADGTIVVTAPRRALARDDSGNFYLTVVTNKSTHKEDVTVGAIHGGYAAVVGPTIRVGDRVRLITSHDTDNSMRAGVGE